MRNNAFADACTVEAAGVKDIVTFLETQAHHGRFVLTNKGRLAESLQKTVGDAAVNCPLNKIWGIEFKVEEENKHGNFYLETWSNLCFKTTGWMYNLDADVLLYYFLNDKHLFSIPFRRLCRWAFGCGATDERIDPGRIYSFREKKQKKYKQLNDTWGRCVPIDVVREEVGFEEYKLCSGEWINL